jgi:hypothetical protein
MWRCPNRCTFRVLAAPGPFYGPQPDLPGSAAGVEPGFLKFPKNLVTSV